MRKICLAALLLMCAMSVKAQEWKPADAEATEQAKALYALLCAGYALSVRCG